MSFIGNLFEKKISNKSEGNLEIDRVKIVRNDKTIIELNIVRNK